MPVGVIINALSVVIGGYIGTIAGKKMTKTFIAQMNLVIGCCSMGMGISTIFLMEHMPAVIFSLIIGSAIGLCIHLGVLINRGGLFMQKTLSHILPNASGSVSDDFENTLVTCITLFCASGTGIYGSIIAGMSGDHSILITKSILDLVTSAIFACSLGYVTSMVAIPQFLVFFMLFLMGTPLYNGLEMGTNMYIMNNFKACGGFIMLATGFRIAGICNFPIADMLPAMVLVIPVSIFWNNVVAPAIQMFV